MRRKGAGRPHVPAAKSSRRRYWRYLGTALFIGAAALALCLYIENRVDPILDELAEYEARATVTQALDRAVAAFCERAGPLCPQAYRLQYAQDGEVQAVIADAEALDDACRGLTAAVDLALQSLPQRVVYVPFGTLTGLSLLNGLGPGWGLCLQPQAYATGSVREAAEQISVNCTRYSAWLELQVTINMVLDGKNRVLDVRSSIPVASVTVRGQTPLYYGAGS